MINISQTISAGHVYCVEHNSSKKKILELISKSASQISGDVKYQEILASLQSREKIGSTVICEGVAIPHARIPNFPRPLCVLVQLKNKIDFDEKQSSPVGIIISLLIPDHADQDHVAILSSLAKKLKEPRYLQGLIQANNEEQLFQAATNES